MEVMGKGGDLFLGANCQRSCEGLLHELLILNLIRFNHFI
jgi:hypothetical protein